MRRTLREELAAGAALIALFAVPAAADEVADFYKGKTVSVIVGHEVGTGFDIYGRTLARHRRLAHPASRCAGELACHPAPARDAVRDAEPH